MRSAAKRLRKRDVEDLIGQAARIDQQVKGAAPGDPWQTLEYVALRLAGVADVDWLAEWVPAAS
jgi:hypothetical protein